jgi:pyruvate dehydrogenase E1 component alpha subunit
VASLAAVLAARGLGDPQGDVLALRRASPAPLAAAGLDPELLARQARGSAGSWAHGFDPGGVPGLPGWGLIPGVDPPGTLMEVLAGVALAFRLRDEARVALLVTDAEDADSGYWHEGINLAAVQGAPLVVVVHPGARDTPSSARPPVARRADFYGIRAAPAPGDDLEGLVEAVGAAVVRARAGAGTQVVELTAAPSPEDAARARLVAALGEGVAGADDEARRWAGAVAEAARDDAPADRAALRSVSGRVGDVGTPWRRPGRAREMSR